MLQSCKIASDKTLTSENAIYVKGMIKKSYGDDLRPAFLLFDGFNPEKGHCSTPVGASGLCCHILAHLLFLTNTIMMQTKRFRLYLAQNSYKSTTLKKKVSILMVPLTKIKPNSAKMKK